MFKRWLPVMVVLSAALPVGATTTYNTLSAMQSANPGLTFTSIDLMVLQSLSPQSSYTFSGTSFQAGSNTLTYSNNPGGGWSGIVMRTTDVGGSILITLPANTIAFGANFGGVGNFGSVNVTVVGDTTVTTSDIAVGSPQYWGFMSAGGFSTVTLAITPDSFTKPGLNQFVFATGTINSGGGGDTGGSTTPEPSSMALMGGALIAIPILARRRRK